MGRAIDQDNRLDDHEKRLKLLEDAFAEMVQTRVHHVDLDDEMDKHEEKIREENSEAEEFTPPAGRRKKTTRKATATT